MNTVLIEVKGRADIITLLPQRILTAAERKLRKFVRRVKRVSLKRKFSLS